MNEKKRHLILGMLLSLFAVAPAAAEEEVLPDSEVILRAMIDELDRSMSLKMEDLEQPYFIRFNVDDYISYAISAEYGAITSSERDRERDFHSQVRVGSYELDNTNFAGGGGGFIFFGDVGGGGQASLPLDDDYTAIRQAIWWATDFEYKDVVETLTKKRAYMKDKNLQDRPNDFTREEAVKHMAPTARVVFEKAAWEDRLKKISARFKKYPDVQDSGARLYVSGGNRYVVNSEGTRVRYGKTGALLVASATVQAEDGMKISNSLTKYANSAGELPGVDAVLEEVDELVEKLVVTMKAPVLESYTGPVLFDGVASGQMFREMLSKAICGHVDPVGTQRARPDGTGSLEKKLGQRILPKSFRVYDAPTRKKAGDVELLGHYDYDDEGVKAQRVDLVEGGKLKGMIMSRVPTKRLSGSNGHGRRGVGSGSVNPSIGCLFIEDEEGMPADELKAALIEAAQDEGLEYGLRVEVIRSMDLGTSQSDMMSFVISMIGSQGGRRLGDPVLIYKVYVEDGREELVRGCEFGAIETRDLRGIIAAGEKPVVYNYMGGMTLPNSIVAPPVLFEELELTKIEQEHEKPPLLKAPLLR